MEQDQYYDELINRVQKSFELLKFSEAVKEAKEKSPQSFIFHSVSVGTLSMAILDEIKKNSEESVKNLENKFQIDHMSLGFFGGFFHDWMKLYSEKEEESGEYKFPPEAKSKAIEIAKKTGLPNSDKFINLIANFAEGPLSANEDYPLWISVKIADMLMISAIRGVNDVFYFAEKKNYAEAIKGLNAFNLKLSYLQSSPRLFTLLASEKIINEINGRPLISYHDGVIYLSKGEEKVSLKKLYEILHKTLKGSVEDVSEILAPIEKCIKNKEELWRELNKGNVNVLYDEDKKAKQLNAFLPTKVCNYFDDIVASLDDNGKIRVASELIEKYKNDIPFALIVYFIEKFSKNPKNKDYVKDALGIKEKFPHYLISIEDKEKILNDILEALKKRYSEGGKQDPTLASFVRKSFKGDLLVDIAEIKEKPKNYCIVCGTPIYGESISFKQFSTLLKGKAEIWIPKEKAMEDIDSITKYWVVCPICNYEANVMSKDFKPPFLLVSFYPGIPVDLLKILRFNVDNDNKFSFNDVIKDEIFKKIYEESGGKLTTVERRIHPDFFGSKIVISANLLEINYTETRLTKEVLNTILPSVPLISISFLSSPIFITSNIHDFPLTSNHIEISSEYNYLWLKGLDNIKVLLLALAYRAKYFALKRAIRDNNSRENYLSSLVSEMDKYAIIDPSLSVIALGMAINEESSFLNSLLPYSYFLNQVFGKVSKMGETFSKSLYSIAKTLKEAIKDKDPSKHDIIGFFRDGVDMFFKTSSISLAKEDRVGISANTALNTLQNKYKLNDNQSAIIFSNLRDIFSLLYDIEDKSDRSLAISISTALANWLYILYKSLGEENE